MQIKMIGTFSYDVVPGSTRRTLHEGLVLEEASDVAMAAIAAGKAERWPPQREATAVDENTGDDAGSGDEKTPTAAPAGKGKGGKGKSKPEASPTPAAAPPAAAASEPAPAEPVEPGAGD